MVADDFATIVYAARHKNKAVLKQSSSGGVFTALSDYFLKEGYAVASSVYNYESHENEFELILDFDSRDKARGSKYMQSKVGDIYEECFTWLSQNPEKKLLFVGTGCQAAGFKKYAELKGIQEKVYTVDIICHGVPSPMIWKQYADSIEKKEQAPIEFLTFKDKRNGWNNPTAFVDVAGKEIRLNEYLKVYYDHCSLRPSCNKCPYATTNRITDMTIGDYWGIEKKIPEFYSPDGNSLVLIHTDKGERLFNSICDDLEFCRSNLQDCIQPNLENPTEAAANRAEFWDDYGKFGAEYVLKKYGGVSVFAKIKNKLKKIIAR